MKRIQLSLVSALLLVSLLFSSCSATLVPPVSDQEPVSVTEEKETLPQTDDGKTVISPEDQAKIDGASALLTTKLLASQLESLPLASADMTKDELRRLCLDYFELQLSFQWTPNADVTDYPSTYYNFSAPKTLDLGSVYGGIPYQSIGTGNLYRWMEYYDEETGVFDIVRAFRENGGDVKTDIEKDENGNVTYYKRRCMMIFFNQCSVASFWGWARVINSAHFAWTGEMTVKNGFIPVGGFTYGYEHEGKQYGMDTISCFGKTDSGNPKGYDTKNVIADWKKLKGNDAMYLCYAEMKPADLVVSGGHVMMVKSVKPVYLASGKIDPVASEAVMIEQIEGWGKQTTIGDTPYKVQGGVDRVYSFEKLQTSRYIPFTFAEFLEEGDPRLQNYKTAATSAYKVFPEAAEKVTVGVEPGEVYCNGPTENDYIHLSQFKKITVGSNYPISDVFVELKDENGNTVLKNTYRATSARIREVSMSAQHASWDSGRKLYSDLDDFLTGDYYVEISLQISTGQKLLAYRNLLIGG
ncbi:MAG: hypothetical protein IKD31_05755 [Clostridia bacterium]|nr:hypothetical protein [Clostridia bacterium]